MPGPWAQTSLSHVRAIKWIATLPRWVQDGGIGAAIFLVSWSELASGPSLGTRPELAVVLLGALTLSLTLRRYQPSAVLFTMAVATLLISLPDFAGSNGYITVFGFILAMFSVASQRPARVSVPMVAVAGATFYLAGLIGDPYGTHSWREFLGFAFPVTMMWVFGNQLRIRRFQAEAAQARADRLENDRALVEARAAAEERARIARELHDVVAHSLSVMVVQAGAARRVAGSQPAVTLDALSSIETTGRQAMTEMRRLLGMLRKEEPNTAALAPQPGLDRISALLEQVRAAGLEVDLRAEGPPVPLPPGLDVSAYRIVQEALTNCLRHAGARRVVVKIAYFPRELRLTVSDDGKGASPDGVGDSGHGLAGMRERVEMFGGRLDAQGKAGEGFTVTATLPLATAP